MHQQQYYQAQQPQSPYGLGYDDAAAMPQTPPNFLAGSYYGNQAAYHPSQSQIGAYDAASSQPGAGSATLTYPFLQQPAQSVDAHQRHLNDARAHLDRLFSGLGAPLRQQQQQQQYQQQFASRQYGHTGADVMTPYWQQHHHQQQQQQYSDRYGRFTPQYAGADMQISPTLHEWQAQQSHSQLYALPAASQFGWMGDASGWPVFAQGQGIGLQSAFQEGIPTAVDSAWQAAPADQPFAFDDNDYPSYAKPPHRDASEVRPVVAMDEHEEPATFYPAEQIPIEAIASQEVIPELIAPGASAIPPPPAIEKSAYPLAALATDIVWQAFLAACSKDLSCPPSPALAPWFGPTVRNARTSAGHPGSANNSGASSPMTLAPSAILRSDRSRSAGVANEGLTSSFGAIGGERKPARLSNEYSPGSDSTSPASTAPGTPDVSNNSAWLSQPQFANKSTKAWQKVSTAPRVSYGSEDESPSGVRAPHHLLGKDFLLPAPLALPTSFTRGQGVTQQQQSQQAARAPPLMLFEQIQKFLGATLLSQQVLLLGLYFVSKLPHTSPLYPPATSASALRSTSAPFKLLLAALVVANKHLDDNSFRNSTFASVSDVTLNEINALEYSLLSGLHFDINIDTQSWTEWLREVEHVPVSVFAVDQMPAHGIVTSLLHGVAAQRSEITAAKTARKHPVSLSSVLPACALSSSPRGRRVSKLGQSHPNHFWSPASPLSDRSSFDGFDLDAAGPLEAEVRPRYRPTAALHMHHHQLPGLHMPAFSMPLAT